MPQNLLFYCRPLQFSLICCALALFHSACTNTQGRELPAPAHEVIVPPIDSLHGLDTAAFDQLVKALGAGDSTGRWQSITMPYPDAAAILPFQRVVAFYGNFYSKQMGILGELPEAEMLELLQTEVARWEQADSLAPVLPAIHYIAVTAQQDPGRGNKYRQRMPREQIEKALTLAKKIDAIVMLDIQVGWSTLQEELPALDTFLSMPNVHLGIDPEFSMKTGVRPGKQVGTFDAEDINFAAQYLAGLVKQHQLPPKILVVHRFTKGMVTNYQDIKLLPDVQLVMHMDGWGGRAYKKATYRQVIYPEPVQFAGFKVFYKHDTRKVNAKTEMQPEEILELVPKPVYIQYQ